MPTDPNPFLGGPAGFTAPTPPQIQPRSFGPTTIPPGLVEAIKRYQDAMALQQLARQGQGTPEGSAMPAIPATPAAAPGPAGPQGFMQNLLYQAALAKFNHGLPTPLADRAGWSSGWGARPAPIGMAGLPAQPAMPSPQSFMAPIGLPGAMNSGFGMPGGMTYAQAADQSQIGLQPSQSKNQNIGGNPGY